MAPHRFTAEIVNAVLRHMNTDHAADNLVIVRAFADPSAESATMIDLDGDGGTWSILSPGGESAVRVAWAHAITERHEIRREVAELYGLAQESTSISPQKD